MNDGRQHEAGRHKVDFYRASHAPWNMMNQHQVKEPNALVMNKKIMSIIAERDIAIMERDVALSEKNAALAERNEAFRERDEAFAERDTARMERDAALAAIQVRNKSTNAVKRSLSNIDKATYGSKETQITNAFPITVIHSEAIESHQPKNKARKCKTEWGSQELGLNVIAFDESTMPVPVCSCTGAPRQCYKWGSGGWQSSCCTTHMSMYPLPQVPNKRHARMGGRKMSGSVFTRLLSRLALQGHNLSMALDLKEYWARHGTNRYITIK